MKDAFALYAELDLEDLETDQRMRQAARSLHISCDPTDSWESVFHRIFLSHVEPRLPRERPLFLMDYPQKIPTLARRKKGTIYSERWELYISGIEIANCYTEETDPHRIGSIVRAEAIRKERNCQVPHTVDYELSQCFGDRRIPECSGVALGLDRLLMVLMEANSLNGVVMFPISDIITKR